MSRDEYLARADLADRQRQRARNDEERETYEQIAQLWRSLAGRTGDRPKPSLD